MAPKVVDMAPVMALNGFGQRRASKPGAALSKSNKRAKPSGLREKIRALEDRPYRDVKVPEWGGLTVRMRAMGGNARGEFDTHVYRLAQRYIAAGDAEEEAGAKAAIESMVDAVIICAEDPKDGSKLFARSDRSWLLEKNAAAIGRLSIVAFELSGLGEEAVAAGKASSPTIPTSTAGSDSPASSAAL